MEYLGGKPLCMNQYYEVLSSCRIPGLKRDSVVNHAKSSQPPKHITVVHNFQVRSTGPSHMSVSEILWDEGPVSQRKFNLVWLSLGYLALLGLTLVIQYEWYFEAGCQQPQ